MGAGHRLYRWLLVLYPRSFRDRYADDLVQSFADLVAARGPRAAWARTGVDLLVTIPRYRLETAMTESSSDTAVTVTIALLAAAGVLTFLMGLPPGLVLVALALALGLARRSTLARAIRAGDSGRRRRRLRIAAVLGVASLATIVSYMRAVADEDVSGLSLILHNAIGVPAMVGSIAFLVVGLLTPRSSPLARRPS